MFTFGTQQQDAKPSTTQQTDGDRQAKLAHVLKALNNQFREWVDKQDIEEIWIDGVEDYIAHAKKLLEDFDDILKDTKKDAVSKESAPAPSTGGFTFGSSQSTAAPVFNFAAKTDQMGSGASSTGGFSFGAAAPTSFGFGGNAAFTSENKSNGATNDAPEDEEENEEVDNEPSLELESDSADIVLKQRVKLMSNDPETKKWKSRGIGTLSIRQAKEASSTGSRAAYMVFTTDAGRVLLNAPLVKGLKPTMNPKAPKNVVMMLISRVDPDQPEERGLQLFQSSSAESASELLNKINEFV